MTTTRKLVAVQLADLPTPPPREPAMPDIESSANPIAVRDQLVSRRGHRGAPEGSWRSSGSDLFDWLAAAAFVTHEGAGTSLLVGEPADGRIVDHAFTEFGYRWDPSGGYYTAIDGQTNQVYVARPSDPNWLDRYRGLMLDTLVFVSVSGVTKAQFKAISMRRRGGSVTRFIVPRGGADWMPDPNLWRHKLDPEVHKMELEREGSYYYVRLNDMRLFSVRTQDGDLGQLGLLDEAGDIHGLLDNEG